MASIFTKIINGEIPCHKVAEDENFFAFLDIRPLNPGHVLVIPKLEIDYLFDLPDELLSGMLIFARPIARAVERVVDCERVGLLVAGLEVPHAHLHLVPFKKINELTFERARDAGQDELAGLAARIRAELAKP